MIQAGIWVNRHRAVVIHLINNKERIINFTSQLPADAWIQGNFFQQGEQKNVAAQRTAKYEKQIHKYYKKVAFSVKDAEQIFIFGPDSARIELKKEMKKTRDWVAKIQSVERADEMKDEEIIKKVRLFFKSSDKKGNKDGRP